MVKFLSAEIIRETLLIWWIILLRLLLIEIILLEHRLGYNWFHTINHLIIFSTKEHVYLSTLHLLLDALKRFHIKTIDRLV